MFTSIPCASDVRRPTTGDPSLRTGHSKHNHRASGHGEGGLRTILSSPHGPLDAVPYASLVPRGGPRIIYPRTKEWMMNTRTTPAQTLAHALHRHLLPLLLLTYALAALFPAWGVWMRDARPLSMVTGEGARSTPALPSLLLAFLLFHAGLRVQG